ncbi:MAG: glycosyltransferase family 39 protein [Chlamydiia bacterium]|nr:glycosyltransferase family 39 protein [Chlamydiia bacterium]
MESNTTRPKSTNLWSILALVALLKAIWIGLFVSGDPIGLGPDEAQYWMWSRLLDWGYYSKPPGIAWSIAVGRALFGDTLFGVRFVALCAGAALPFASAYLAIASGFNRSVALLAGILIALSPPGILASLFATTDGPMALFLTLALACFCQSITHKKPSNYLWIGILIGCAALFKWPAYLLWIPILLTALFRPHMRSSTLIPGVLLSACALLPSLYWNFHHDWATWRHVGTAMTSHGEQSQALFGGNPLDFIGAQFLLLTPLPVYGLYLCWRRRRKLPEGAKIVALFAGSLLLLFICASLFKKMQGNWGSFLFPSLFVLAAWSLTPLRTLRRLSIWSTAILSALAFSLPALMVDPGPLPAKWNPFKQTMGWKKIAPLLSDAGFSPDQHFLFSDRYQTSTELAFYAPGQPQTYLLNTGGGRRTQFDYWPQMEEEQIGRTGYFAWVETRARDLTPEAQAKRREELIRQLTPYFKEIRWRGFFPLLEQNSTPIKGMILLECQGYNGHSPEPSGRW